MKIRKPEIVHQNNLTICRANVESAKGKEILWYSLHDSYANLLSLSSDAFLVALLIPAMAMAEDIHIDGRISEGVLNLVEN